MNASLILEESGNLIRIQLKKNQTIKLAFDKLKKKGEGKKEVLSSSDTNAQLTRN